MIKRLIIARLYTYHIHFSYMCTSNTPSSSITSTILKQTKVMIRLLCVCACVHALWQLASLPPFQTAKIGIGVSIYIGSM